MVRRALVTILLACLVAGPVAAQPRKEPARKEAVKKERAGHANEDPVVARVNGEPIHRSELVALKEMLPPQARQLPDQQLYPRLLDEAVSLALVVQAAHKTKVIDDPLVRLRMQLASNQVLEDAYFGSIINKEITQDKLRERYEDYIKANPSREEVKARHILVPTEAEAKEIIAELNKGADFATLAREKTTDPSGKASGGELGWFSRDEMVPAFAAAAFKLKKGEYTQTPVKTQFGWHVIKVEDKRVGKPASYEEMAPRLAQQMAQELASARVKQLAAASHIEVFRPDGSPMPPPPAVAPPAATAAPRLTPPALNPMPAAPGAPTLAPGTENLGQPK